MLAAALLPSPRSAGAEAARPDPKAAALADRVMQALGGAKAWNNTHYLRFDFAVDKGGKTVVRRAEAWDKVRLTFDSVGLTPKDKYWAYVNRKTGLVDRWDYVLKGDKKPPSAFTWANWKAYGKIKLADDRVNAADGTRIYFPVLEVPASVPEATFTTP